MEETQENYTGNWHNFYQQDPIDNDHVMQYTF